MNEINDKRARADLFRRRLAQAMQSTGTTQSGLAREIGTDRSTLSQALKDEGARLPGAHVVGACASALGVSCDWLLGLSDRPESAADLLSAAFVLTHAPRALIDETIFSWHREAAGYKIRHVPAALPDMLKTQEMLEWEYSPHLGRTITQAINASRDRLDWMRSSQSDYEIAMPLYELHSFATGTGYYHGLPAPVRRAQLHQLIELTEQLYPRLRVTLFDARRLYATPITIFGPLLAVLYTGGHYMAFRDRPRIETLTTDFDMLIRQASITARDMPVHLTELRPLIC
ncbi:MULTISPECIES: helix-turn-helix domain-containing protein [Roseobacteraceae]|jgi:transcriptional regulator with XRE-family HTH domain|uniref:Helix-turn-helix protein n=1 Tax=Pseudosulfitobacter pseudonitzschiae TaxID=1402135 RepID=A0A221K1L1_9RHOB|nr:MULTISPECIES: helix-turn-helix transcriptional regulator [Roseobacteraceae]ASM72859.1 helix-turn-helix protein [Pseudosulfitobacter pseudonitzschiae]